jgi:hypothetical protein
MNSLNWFRIALMTLALATGSYALASSLADWSALSPPTFPSDLAKFSSSISGEAPEWLKVASPFRSDLESDHALIDALQTVQSGEGRPTPETSNRNDLARARLRKSLSITPYNSELWLALALLQAQRDPRDPSLVEALKMSYFVAPNEIKLMPVRLDTATRFNALADPDLKELARGDGRLMITRQPALRAAVISAYRRASSVGKAFLDEAVQSINPSFLPVLRG